MVPVRSRLLSRSLLVAAVALASSPASATLTVREWFVGEWNCKLDGRQAWMVWEEQGKGWVGRFSDHGAPWVHLRLVRRSDGRIDFTHTPDNTPWKLAMAENGGAVGNSTWQGKRYPLECFKTRFKR